MDKTTSLTLAEALELESELVSQGVTISKPLIEVKAGTYSGKFQTQKVGNAIEPVIDYIAYNRDNKPMGFFAVKADFGNDDKSYTDINVGMTDQLKEVLSDKARLAADQIFVSKQGRQRKFVAVEL